ncbi:MAG: 2,4-dihydroxyhept-2-ene-1,7-dioic acid aldolase, partial [Candidatus Cloacimonetes bacterium]|nr:2,4-dihydroxyhept-2-ene-1,7-dioic acid aldolase [Candidatus Cloacimonadota bacterium]
MKQVDLKKKLLSNSLTIGSWLSFGYTPVTEIMAQAGFEWLVIDMEHTSIDDFAAMQMIQIISLSKCVPLVRVGKNDELIIKRVMDSGAQGVIVPMINSKDDAERAVNAVKYPPTGNRGVGLSRAQKYGVGFEEYKKWIEKNSIVIVQIEHIKGVENLPEIMSIEGVNGFIIGPYDLSASMGIPGKFEDIEFINTLHSVEKFINKSNKPGGFHVVHSDVKLLQEKIDKGYRFIAYGDDMVFFAEKMKEEANNLKEVVKCLIR